MVQRPLSAEDCLEAYEIAVREYIVATDKHLDAMVHYGPLSDEANEAHATMDQARVRAFGARERVVRYVDHGMSVLRNENETVGM